ncbi:MAG: GAF domain-containing protein [Actinobacteria bacterium]|nr:MAG: GAF domain-containing protein [Actinomycetota bacterium]
MKSNEKLQQELNQIEKSRWQLLGLALALIIIFTITIVSISYLEAIYSKAYTSLVNYKTSLISLFLLVLAFCVYVVDKERRLRRLSRKLISEQVRASELDQKVDQVSAILEAGKAVNSVLDSDKVLDVILKAAFKLLSATKGSIMLINKKTNLLEIVNSCGLKPEVVKNTRIRIGESVSGWVAAKGKPLLLSGEVKSKKFKNVVKKEKTIQSSIVVPLKTKDKTIGVISLNVGGSSRLEFDKHDLNMAQVFAGQVAMAIENSRLYDQTKENKERFASLNKKLAERNKEFKKANVELKSANKELEKFNRLTVNRELQMIKFKEEMNRLESRLSAKKHKLDNKRLA